MSIVSTNGWLFWVMWFPNWNSYNLVYNRPGTPQLMAEVQRLWKEVALYKCNLARAEIQVRILDDDNKDLRLALRNKMSTASPPVSKKVMYGLIVCLMTMCLIICWIKMPLFYAVWQFSTGFMQGKTSSSLFDNVGSKKDTRQPLTSLQSNMLNLRWSFCIGQRHAQPEFRTIYAHMLALERHEGQGSTQRHI